MRQSIRVVLSGLFFVGTIAFAQANEHHHHETTAAAANPPSQQQQLISAKGVIKDIDLANKKITIEHEAIPAIGWPAMTMRFTFTTQDASISALKPGNHVSFVFVQQDTISLLQEINITQV